MNQNMLLKGTQNLRRLPQKILFESIVGGSVWARKRMTPRGNVVDVESMGEALTLGSRSLQRGLKTRRIDKIGLLPLPQRFYRVYRRVTRHLYMCAFAGGTEAKKAAHEFIYRLYM